MFLAISMMNKGAQFQDDTPPSYNVDLILRAQLNFWKRPILCKTLCGKPIQASDFGGTFDQNFLWIFVCDFYRRCLSTFSLLWYKKSKMTKNSNQGRVLPVAPA